MPCPDAVDPKTNGKTQLKFKFKEWMTPYKDWLTYSALPEDEYWCKICSRPIKRKKYNVEYHASTQRHKRQQSGMNEEDIPSPNFEVASTEMEPNGIVSVEDDNEIASENIYFHLIEVNDSSEGENVSTVDEDGPMQEESSFQINSEEIEDFPESSSWFLKIMDDVLEVFASDIENLLLKNKDIVSFIQQNSSFSHGENGKSRLARMMVGHLVQFYLTDYSLDSSKNHTSPNFRNMLQGKINLLEEAIDASKHEISNLKAELIGNS